MAQAANVGAPSLTRMSEKAILNELTTSITDQARSSTFSCSGTIPVQKSFSGDASDSNFKTSPPVRIRYGEPWTDRHFGMVLPSLGSEGPVEQLASICSPATFGRGDEDVLDESYRKAGELDDNQFTTTFCPYTLGIVDVIAQLLLPKVVGGKPRSVRAEAYKLNVYSAPDGMFKPHVDTPRNVNQFGSLVVALPVAHGGGDLKIRSHGKETIFRSEFDEDEGDAAIKWVAFYSDCEHEVAPVTAGHRITLTYNLFSVTPSSGLVAGNVPGLFDPTELPLYNFLRAALETPKFLEGGRLLGIHLTHSYAHTSEKLNFLPSSLKGSDMVLFETALALGLKCCLRPFMSFEEVVYDSDGDDYVEKEIELVGHQFRPFTRVGGQADGGPEVLEDVMENWPSRRLKGDDIVWVNKPESELREPALAQVTYGNQAELTVRYSTAVLLIEVPNFSERTSCEVPQVIDDEDADVMKMEQRRLGARP